MRLAAKILLYVLLGGDVLPCVFLFGRGWGGIHTQLSFLQGFSALYRGKGIRNGRLFGIHLQLGACGILLQRLSDGVVNAFKHRLFVGKLDLQLGGMHVDVHAHGVQTDEQHAAREFFGSTVRRKGLLQRGRRRLALDVSRVDKEILIVAVGADVIGAADIAVHRNALVFAAHLDQAGGEILAKHRPDGAFELSVPCCVQLDVAVHDQSHRNAGVRERDLFDVGGNRHGLGDVTLQELAACRHVGKQILGDDGRAHGTATLRDVHDLAAIHLHLCTDGGIGRARKHTQARDCRDSGQCLTAEAQRADSVQILGGADFTGGMTADAHGKILGRHAVSVIGHAHKRHATVLNFHGNP